jgi:hypothetical protein
MDSALLMMLGLMGVNIAIAVAVPAFRQGFSRPVP